MDSKDEPVPNANQRPASKLHVHVQGKPDHMAVGTKNTIVFFRATSKDDDTNNNNIQSGVTSDIVILSEKNEVKCKYKSNPGESTIITIGNNCDIVEIAINPDLEQKLKETGEFQVTKGDKLVSIRWKNDDNWSNDEEAYCEWKIRFTKDGKKVDTLKLEKEIFEKMVDENNNDLRDLVTELITIYNAKLQHIESGCIQLVLSTQSPEDARRLEKQKDELKALLHRTIIPESIEIDLEFQSTDSSQEQDGLDKENPVSGEHKMLPKDGQISLEDDPLSDTEVEKVNIQDEIVKPQRAGRVLSQFIKLEPVSGNMFDSNQKERVLIEKRSMKRTVGSGPQIQQFKEVNPPNFEAMTARELWSSRQLMSPNSEPIRSPENVDISFPIMSEGEQGITKFDIINEENVGSSRMSEPTDFEVAGKSSDGAASLAIITASTSTCSSRNTLTLHSAIKNHEDVQKVSALLETTVDVDEKDDTGNTALHLAVQCNNKVVVQLLLQRNAYVDCANANLDQPLHLACVANKLDIVALLLENNASTHSTNVDGDTPLHLAMRFGFMEAIDLLLEKLKYPDTKNEVGDTSLHVAARYGISAAVTKLVRARVSIDLKNGNSETPLLVAVKSNKLAVARALIDNGANVNCVDQHGDSPLHIAASMFMDDIAHLLLDHQNIDVNIYNNERYTPAYLARGGIRHRLTMAGSSTRKGWGCLMM